MRPPLLSTYDWVFLISEFGCGTIVWGSSCIPFCGSAKTSEHNITFLRSLECTLQLDPVFNRGWYSSPPQEGLRAFARIYSAWGFSQSFYREKLYVRMGFPTLDSFLIGKRIYRSHTDQTQWTILPLNHCQSSRATITVTEAWTFHL